MKYLVSYWWWRDGENGIGRAFVNQSGPLAEADIENVELMMRESEGFKRVAVINFQVLAG